jgi:hypothetical protein
MNDPMLSTARVKKAFYSEGFLFIHPRLPPEQKEKAKSAMQRGKWQRSLVEDDWRVSSRDETRGRSLDLSCRRNAAVGVLLLGSLGQLALASLHSSHVLLACVYVCKPLVPSVAASPSLLSQSFFTHSPPIATTASILCL